MNCRKGDLAVFVSDCRNLGKLVVVLGYANGLRVADSRACWHVRALGKPLEVDLIRDGKDVGETFLMEAIAADADLRPLRPGNEDETQVKRAEHFA